MKSFARVVALLLALALAACQFLPWVGEARATEIAMRTIVSPGQPSPSSWWLSLGLPLTVAAVLAGLGALAGGRVLVVLGALIGVGIPAAWALVNVLSDQSDVQVSALGFGLYGAAVCGFLLLVLAAVAADAREQSVR